MSRFESLDSLEREQYLIKCPVCGQEYLPAELFLPSDFLGRPTDIVKTNSGKIDFYLGEKPSYETEYICDNCSTTFKVKAKVIFDTSVKEESFDTDYVSKLKSNILGSEVNLFDENSAEKK